MTIYLKLKLEYPQNWWMVFLNLLVYILIWRINLNVCNCNIPCFGKYGIETAPPVGPKVQDKVPSEIKNSKFPEEFTVQTNVRNKVRIYELGSLL